MAGARVNNYSPSTADLTSLMATVDGDRVGYSAVSLTEYLSTSRPAIAGGSLIEIAGALFRFSTTEAISTAGVTSTAAQYYYIRFSPSSSECSVGFSTTEPTWRTDLQGLYHSTISADRCLDRKIYFDGTDYIYKATIESPIMNVGRRSTDAALLHDDIPVYGYMSDGTPLYSKIITITIPLNDSYDRIAHGVANALTNNRIVSAVAYCRTLQSYNLLGVTVPGWPVSNANYWATTHIGVDDTYLYAYRASASGAASTYDIFVVYK